MKRNLMDELTEGIDALTESRKMERDRLDERLGKNRERVNQEELYAPHMEEEQYINRDQLTDYDRTIDKLFGDIQKLKDVRDKMIKESQEIEQILGKALGYPWFKDDPANFPHATEADGVCVAPNTAASLAMHVADRIKMMDIRELDKQRIIDEQKEEIKTLRKVIADVANNLGNGSAVSTEASIEFIQEVPKEVKLVCDGLRKEVKNWQQCADDLSDYAHEFVQNLSAWGKGYDRYDKDIKKAEDAIEAYIKLKK